MASTPESFTVGVSTQTTFVTVASESLCHYITDDELDRLGQMQHEPVMEICLAAIGAFAGSLIPAVEALSRFQSDSDPMGIVGLLTIVVAVASFGIAGVTGFLWKQRLKTKTVLTDDIRCRPRVQVTSQ